MRSPPGTQLQPVSSRTSSGHISRPWLTLARGAWVACALLLLANFEIFVNEQVGELAGNLLSELSITR